MKFQGSYTVELQGRVTRILPLRVTMKSFMVVTPQSDKRELPYQKGSSVRIT